MPEYRVGDRVRVTRYLSEQVQTGDLATVISVGHRDDDKGYIVMDVPRGRRPIAERADGAHWAFYKDSNWLERVPAEQMVPMSRVREVATRYAQSNGWCDEVDRALAEIESGESDELVEVTYTATRRVTLRRNQLEFLRDKDDMSRLFSGIAGQVFYGETVPQGAKLEDNVWSLSEPRSLSDEGWISFGGHNRPGGNPAVGRRVRVRPGPAVQSATGASIAGGTEGRVVESTLLRSGEVSVVFGRELGSRIMKAEDMQAHPR